VLFALVLGVCAAPPRALGGCGGSAPTCATAGSRAPAARVSSSCEFVVQRIPRGGLKDESEQEEVEEGATARDVVERVLGYLRRMVKELLGLGEAEDPETAHVSMAEALSKVMEELPEGKGDSDGSSRSERKANVFRSGRFSKALETARLAGKPVIVALGSAADRRRFRESSLARALGHTRTRQVVDEKLVAWCAWLDAKEATRVSKHVTRDARTTIVLLRPNQSKGGGFSVLASFPSPAKSKGGQKKHQLDVSSKRLTAWVASTLQRFEKELSEDFKVAEDRRLVQEIQSDFTSGLAADLAREEKVKADAAAAAQKARDEDQARKAEEANKRRRDQLRSSLADEPPSGDDVVNLAVRLPSGGRVRRNFRREESLQRVFDWIDCEAEKDVGTFALKKFGVVSGEAKARLEPTPATLQTPISDTGLVSSSLLILETWAGGGENSTQADAEESDE